jgi:regulator of protease activity HflC (stomatin/prohibitin superfamily)
VATKTWPLSAIAGVVAAGLVVSALGWFWFVERVEVPMDHFLVKINLWGKDLPEGEIIAPDASFKGVQRETFAEGRYFLNPLFTDYRIFPATIVSKGECLVVTRLAGPPIDPERQAHGEYLARGGFEETGAETLERGILEKPLTPRKYYINPFLYHTQPGEVKKLEANQVGVRTLRWGKDPAGLRPVERKSPYVVPDGYRGVQARYLKPETYYYNPQVETIDIVDISKHVVEFTDIAFPSKDGFDIRPRIRISYQVMPDNAPEVFVVLTDHGVLHQADQTEDDKSKNQILQKFILPLVRGTVRIEGSKSDAVDFISAQEMGGNPLKRLQAALEKSVTAECERMGVRIDSIAVMQPDLTEKNLAELADTITQRDNSVAMRRTNAELVKRYEAKQEQTAKELLAAREKTLTEIGGRLEAAGEKAKQDLETTKIDLEQQLKSAEVRLEAARNDAMAIRSRAQAKAEVVKKDNEAQVESLKTAVNGFPSPEQFAQYHVLNRLTPSLGEIFASDQSDFAKLFTGYMTPLKKPNTVTAPAGAPGSTAVSR